MDSIAEKIVASAKVSRPVEVGCFWIFVNEIIRPETNIYHPKALLLEDVQDKYYYGYFPEN